MKAFMICVLPDLCLAWRCDRSWWICWPCRPSFRLRSWNALLRSSNKEQTNWCWNRLSVRFNRYAVLLDRAPVRTRKVGDCDGSRWSGWLEVKQRWFQWGFGRQSYYVLLHTAAITTAQGLMLVGPPGCGKTMLVQVEKSLSIHVSTSKSHYHTNKTFHSHPLSLLHWLGSRQRDQGSTQAEVQDEPTNKYFFT